MIIQEYEGRGRGNMFLSTPVFSSWRRHWSGVIRTKGFELIASRVDAPEHRNFLR